MMHEWDAALMCVLPKYYKQAADPQTLTKIKNDMIQVMREKHHLHISEADAQKIKVEWLAEEEAVNLVIPHELLTQTIH